MKRNSLLLLIVSSLLAFTNCSKADVFNDPDMSDTEDWNGSNNSNNSNNNGNNTATFKPSDVNLSSSHTLTKGTQGYMTGDINAYVSNSSSMDIQSVRVVLKSKNQSDKSFSLGTIKGRGYEKSTGRFNITNAQYPYLVCTFTCNGKSYSKEYSY